MPSANAEPINLDAAVVGVVTHSLHLGCRALAPIIFATTATLDVQRALRKCACCRNLKVPFTLSNEILQRPSSAALRLPVSLAGFEPSLAALLIQKRIAVLIVCAPMRDCALGVESQADTILILLPAGALD